MNVCICERSSYNIYRQYFSTLWWQVFFVCFFSFLCGGGEGHSVIKHYGILTNSFMNRRHRQVAWYQVVCFLASVFQRSAELLTTRNHRRHPSVPHWLCPMKKRREESCHRFFFFFFAPPKPPLLSLHFLHFNACLFLGSRETYPNEKRIWSISRFEGEKIKRNNI